MAKGINTRNQKQMSWSWHATWWNRQHLVVPQVCHLTLWWLRRCGQPPHVGLSHHVISGGPCGPRSAARQAS